MNGEDKKMRGRKDFLVFTSVLLLLLQMSFFLTSCNLLPVTGDGVIKGRVLLPPESKALSRDVTGWIPALKAMVTLLDEDEVTQSVQTDEYGYFSFKNIAVKNNTVVTATVKVNGNMVILKKIIPVTVEKDKYYDMGILTPGSTALTLIVERILDKENKGLDIDLDKLKETTCFDELVGQVKKVLEEFGNVIENDVINSLIQNIIDEYFNKNQEQMITTPAVKPIVKAIDITTEPPEVNGLENNNKVRVSLSTATPDAVLYYTLNGATPSSNSTKYTAPFIVSTAKPEGEIITVKAMGTRRGYTNSAVSTRDITFKVKICTLTYNHSANGSVIGEILQAVEYGNDGKAVEALPDEGYYFVKWSDGSLDNPRMDTNVNKDVTVEAIFEEIAVTGITVKSQPDRLNYVEGQNLKLEGLIVTLLYNNTSTEDVVFVDFGKKGIIVSPDDGIELSTTDHDRMIVITHTASGKTINTDNLSIAARALTIEADLANHQITITSNYRDVVTGSTEAMIIKGGINTSWVNLGNELQVKVTTDFPSNMTCLTLAPDAKNDIAIVSGYREKDTTVIIMDQPITVNIRDIKYYTVTKSFTVEVSGSGDGCNLTIGTITVLP